MKKRILSFLMACFMVASTFIISRPLVDVHAVEADETKWTMDPGAFYDTGTDGPFQIGYLSGSTFKNITTRPCAWNATSTSETTPSAENWFRLYSWRSFETFAYYKSEGPELRVNPMQWSGTWGSSTATYSSLVLAVAFTAPADGFYSYKEVVHSLGLNADGDASKQVIFKVKNGATEINTTDPDPKEDFEGTLEGIIELNAGDVLYFTATTYETPTVETINKTTDAAENYFGAGIDELVIEKLEEYECKHEAEVTVPNCLFAGICSVCNSAAVPIDPDNHVLDGNNTAYYTNGDGTHKHVYVCCKEEYALAEDCVYGDDNVCTKCGFDGTVYNNKDDAFDNVFNGGNNVVTAYGPASGALDTYKPAKTGTDVEGVEYKLFNIHHLEDGTVKLRHHFVITTEDTYTITLNGNPAALTNVKGTDMYYFDTDPVVGKFDVADEISVNGTVTYSVSLYSYIQKALASGELDANQQTYLNALYDLNEGAKEAKHVYIGIANQKSEYGESGRAGGYIDIYDISTGNMNTPIRSYKTATSAISGFKFRNSAKYGEVLVMTGAYDGAIVSMETGETLWKTSEAAQNSHSIELLPNGVLVTASSAGCALDFFNTNLPADNAINTTDHLRIELDDAHGVLWDPKYNVLWATGRNHLWALEVTLGEDGSITVTKNEELSATMPINNGHDLQPYYGNKDCILVTGSEILVYNKATKTFAELPRDATGYTVTGISVLPNGDIVYIYPDKLVENWCSTWINHIDAETREITEIHSNQGRFYKMRPLNYDYQ